MHLDLTIFHYHFLTGGVTSVVTRAIAAFRQHLEEVKKIRLVAGRTPADRSRLEALDVEITIYPWIDYLDPERSPNSGPESRKLAARLLEDFGSDNSVWWIHNYHLGKNPIFTEALLQILKSDSRQKMIFQIHDFPECGRYQNLAFLNQMLTLPPYPISPKVHYTVLTDRDRKILLKAGIPSALVSVLENPVAPYFPSPREKQKLKGRLAAAFKDRNFTFHPEHPLFFYPVRAIRRKNVFEAALIARLLDRQVNLMVTLPGTSRLEAPYSTLVEKGYRNGIIRGIWNIGADLEQVGLQFEDLIGASDLLLSSSIQEGFGYLFINALQWGLPLAARDLDILTGMKELFSDYPVFFYENILCPLPIGERQKLLSSYEQKVRGLQGVLPAEEIARLKKEFHSLFEQELIDFSYLPAELQLRLLSGLESEQARSHFRRVNKNLIVRIQALLHAQAPNKEREVEDRFGHKRYAFTFKRILNALLNPGKLNHAVDPEKIQPEIIKHFARKEHLRLLYD